MSLLWWRHFVDGDILEDVIAGFLDRLKVKAIGDCLKLGNGTSFATIGSTWSDILLVCNPA